MADEMARLVWKLARRHTWGSPLPEDEILRLAAGTDNYDELRDALRNDVLDLQAEQAECLGA